MPPKAPKDAAVVQANFAEQIAQVCRIYGIPARYGQLYALLFLSPDPLSLSDLAERSQSAKSTTSTAMRSLERYRFVRRRPRGSDRQDYYEVVADPMQIMRDWVRSFLVPEMEVGAQMAAGLDSGIETLIESAGYDDERAERLRARAAVVSAALEQGRTLLEGLRHLTAETPGDSDDA